MSKGISIFLMIFLLNNFTCHGAKHVIGYQPYTGLYYSFLGGVNNLIWCKNNNKTPVVYWGPHSLYYERNGYQKKTNVWEYYLRASFSLGL